MAIYDYPRIRFNTSLNCLEMNVGGEDWEPLPTNGGELSSTLTSSKLYVGNGSDLATAVNLSGDATLANTGALTLATVNSNVGSFTSASVTVNGKGLVTAASSGSAPVTLPSVVTSTTYASGAATITPLVAGLLTTSTIWSVTQITPGASNLPILGFSCTVNGQINLLYLGDPSTGVTARIVFK